jgi:hypothetical protein
MILPFMQISNWLCISVVFVRRMRIFPFMSGSASWANAHIWTKEIIYIITSQSCSRQIPFPIFQMWKSGNGPGDDVNLVATYQLPEPVEAVEERETDVLAPRERHVLKDVLVELLSFAHHNRAACNKQKNEVKFSILGSKYWNETWTYPVEHPPPLGCCAGSS